jgi:hypothetical protein
MADPIEMALRALAMHRDGDPAAATALLRQAADLAPDSAEISVNLAGFYAEEGDFSAAGAAYRHALKLRPGDPVLRQALRLLHSRADLVGRLLAEGVALAEQNRLAEAETCFIKGLRMMPRSVVAHGNLGALQLRRGEVTQALQTFEHAVQRVGISEDSDRVRADAATAHLLLGDFAKGWPAFEARWRLAGYREMIGHMTMPRWTGAQDIAGKRLLLLAEQGFGDTIQFVRYARLVAARGAQVVPPPLVRLLAPLGAVAGVSWVSLQMGRDAAESGLQLHDWMGEITDFAGTAGLAAGLDLVISVDTAVAHLAGALGRPVWLLNRFDTCWRWLQDRDDSPWYPNLRQFRQVVPGDWSSVIARVAAEIQG